MEMFMSDSAVKVFLEIDDGWMGQKRYEIMTGVGIDGMNGLMFDWQVEYMNKLVVWIFLSTISLMEEIRKIALIGDVGGTNIRLELVQIIVGSDQHKVIKDDKLNVKDHTTFQGALETFLVGVPPEEYPAVAVIAMAGPITNNTVFMANAEHWGTMDGNQLSNNLKIPTFRFLNDFEAASYGILLVPTDQFTSINCGLPDPNKIRAIMGPGTGLGNSVLYPINGEIIVLCSEGGHTDFPTIDAETNEYFHFFCKEGKEGGFNYISIERAFCGPSFPVMFKFFAKKYPQDPEASSPIPDSHAIIKRIIEPNPPRIYESIFQLFFKIYSAAVSNFVTHHLTVGGVYLVNSITKTLIPRLEGKDMFQLFKKRHPDVAKLLVNIPVAVCNVVELGLKGSFFMARRIYSHQ